MTEGQEIGRKECAANIDAAIKKRTDFLIKVLSCRVINVKGEYRGWNITELNKVAASIKEFLT